MEQTLYDKLGGKDTVALVVDQFYKQVLENQTIKDLFNDTDMDRQKRHMTSFISYAIGGPNEYTGRSMEQAHTGLNLTEQHWEAVVDELVSTLNYFNVPGDAIGIIGEKINTLKPHILGK